MDNLWNVCAFSPGPLTAYVTGLAGGYGNRPIGFNLQHGHAGRIGRHGCLFFAAAKSISLFIGHHDLGTRNRPAVFVDHFDLQVVVYFSLELDCLSGHFLIDVDGYGPGLIIMMRHPAGVFAGRNPGEFGRAVRP